MVDEASEYYGMSQADIRAAVELNKERLARLEEELASELDSGTPDSFLETLREEIKSRRSALEAVVEEGKSQLATEDPESTATIPAADSPHAGVAPPSDKSDSSSIVITDAMKNYAHTYFQGQTESQFYESMDWVEAQSAANQFRHAELEDEAAALIARGRSVSPRIISQLERTAKDAETLDGVLEYMDHNKSALGVVPDPSIDQTEPQGQSQTSPGVKQKRFWTRKKGVVAAVAAAGVVVSVPILYNVLADDKPQPIFDPATGQLTPDPSCELTDEAARTEADKTIQALGTEDREGAIAILRAGLIDEFGKQCSSDELSQGMGAAEDRVDEVIGAVAPDPGPSTSETPTTEPALVAEPDGEIFCEDAPNGTRSIDYHGNVPDLEGDMPSDKWEGRACNTPAGVEKDIPIPGTAEVIREIGR